MEHHRIVLPEHLNDQGNLFGGYLLKWIDEFAYITVNIEFPTHQFVTIAMDNVEFKHPIKCGQILRFLVEQARLGTSSVEYEIGVYGERRIAEHDKLLFATRISFVNIAESGENAPIRAD